MELFTSSKEKRHWFYAMIVLAAIMTTLVISSPVLMIELSQEIQAKIFFACMILIVTTVLVHGLILRPSKIEIAIWLGIIAVYLLLILRLEHPERSHMMEYSVLAVFIHKALIERFRQSHHVLKPALLAFCLSFLIGVFDEFVQIFLPNRVFDPLDILFNSLASLLAIGSSLLLQWIRKKINGG